MGTTIGNSGATCPANGAASSSGLGLYMANKIQVGTLNIGGPAATHFATISNVDFYVKGNVTIPSGSELRTPGAGATFGVAGNMTVASGGILTTNGTLLFADLDGAFALTSPVAAQTFTGNVADLRNYSSGATADFASLKINNTNGVTLATDATVILGGGVLHPAVGWSMGLPPTTTAPMMTRLSSNKSALSALDPIVGSLRILKRVLEAPVDASAAAVV